MKKKENKKIGAVQIIALTVFIVVTALACFYIYWVYKNNETESFQELVSSFGPWGVLFMLALQILQVVFAIIPGEPIELAMGALYGTFWGCLICLVGVVIGTILIFLLVKWLGKGFVDGVADSDKFKKLKFLKNPTGRDVFIFLLMFIPGTPKDLLTYFAPFTGINIWRFLVISFIARIPSVISSTYVGKSFASGDYFKSIIAFAAVGAVSLCGIIIYNKIIEKKNSQASHATEDNKTSDSDAK